MAELSSCENKGTSWFWHRIVLLAALEAGEHGKKVPVNLMESNALKRIDTRILALFRETLEHVLGPHVFCLASL